MKVLAFDSWTGGLSHVVRLVEAFRDRDMELILIHIGSWGHDVDRPSEERIGGLLVRDIRYYGRATFEQILQDERPAAVLFLSIQSFAHRAFKRYCTHLGIPTIHLYHGVVGVQQTNSDHLNPVNIRRQISLAFQRATKNFTRLLPSYAKSLWATGAPLDDWIWFARDVWRKIAGSSYGGTASPDASTDICCVYVDADVTHAVTRYHIPRESVFVVGNPDLTMMGLSEDDLGACLQDATDSTQVVYVDTALVDVGAVFADESEFVRHVVQTRDALAAAGLELVVKLHPAHLRTSVPQRLAEAGIRLCTNQEFISTLRRSSGAIVEPSSAAMIPALLGLPVLLAQYGPLLTQAYGAVLTTYPRALALHSLQAVPLALRQAKSQGTPDDVAAWIKSNAGPLPAGDMPTRVADACGALVARRTGNC